MEEFIAVGLISDSINDNDIPRLKRLISRCKDINLKSAFMGVNDVIYSPTRRNKVEAVKELMNLDCIDKYMDDMLDIATSKLNKKSSLNIEKTWEIIEILKDKYEEDNNMVSFVKVFKSNGKDYKEWMK